MAIPLSAPPEDLAAPLAIIADSSLLFTRPLLLDAARVEGDLLSGFCHPGVYRLDDAEGVNGEFAPGFQF